MTHQPDFDSVAEQLLTRRSLLRSAAMGGAGLMLAGAGPAGARILGGAAAASQTLILGTTTDLAPSTFLRIGTDPTSVSLVFDTLADVNPVTKRLTPSVAESWAFSKNNTHLVINLRKNVRYHTGRLLTPQDVIFSLKATLNPVYEAQIGPTVALVKAFKVTGKHQVTLAFKKAVTSAEMLLVFVPLIDSQTVSGLFTGKQVIGTGPFKFGSWTPMNNFTFVKNPHYWQKGLPRLDSVRVNFFSSATAMVNALQAGQISIAYNLVPSQVALLKDDGFVANTSSPAFAEYYVGINVNAAPFQDIRVRQAVAHSLDRARIAEQAFPGFGTPTCLPWSTSMLGIPSSYQHFYKYNPKKAKALLAAAGVTNPTVTIQTGAGNSTTAAILAIVQSGLQSNGFQVNSQVVPNTTLQANLANASVPGMWINNVGQTYLNIGMVLLGNAPLEIGANTSNVTTPRYKKLADDVIFANGAAAEAKANKALSLFMLQQAWHLTVVQSPTTSAIAKNLKGVVASGQSALELTNAQFT
jgi:peptide/nickel transport system substrate-binding protein